MEQNLENLSNELLEKIRTAWLQTEGAKDLSDGLSPYDESEDYFRCSYFQLTSRLLFIEELGDYEKTLQEIPKIRKELEVCLTTFNYFVEMRNASQKQQ